VWGFRANHFTVNVNAFDKLNSLEKVNKFLKVKGILNEYLRVVKLKERKKCFYSNPAFWLILFLLHLKKGYMKFLLAINEFALRYPDVNGKLFSGFHADSADKIFESTNFYKKS
jgi:hypothetical protein